MESLALDDHHDDRHVAQQARDEDYHVEYCHKPEQSLKLVILDPVNGNPYSHVCSCHYSRDILTLQQKEQFMISSGNLHQSRD